MTENARLGAFCDRHGLASLICVSGIAGESFVRLEDLCSKPLNRMMSEVFASTFVGRDGCVKALGGTNFNDAFGRVKQVILQYGDSLKLAGRRNANIPIHYVVVFATDGEDGSANLRKLTVINGVKYPVVTAVINTEMPAASKQALADVSEVVQCTDDFTETTNTVCDHMVTAMQQTDRYQVTNHHPSDFLHVKSAHVWLSPGESVVIHVNEAKELKAALAENVTEAILSASEWVTISAEVVKAMAEVDSRMITTSRPRYNKRFFAAPKTQP